MPKLPTRTGKQVIDVLQKYGFVIDHVTGSHHIMFNEEQNRRITVPLHNKDLPKGTFNAIVKASGLKRTDF